MDTQNYWWWEYRDCEKMDPRVFFPEDDAGFPLDNNPAATRSAKAICKVCPVRNTCCLYAVDTHETEGIWGGVGPNQRRQFRRSLPDSQLRLGSMRLASEGERISLLELHAR